MTTRLSVRKGIALLVVLMLAASSTTAWALTPTVVWQKTGQFRHVFSADGTALLVATTTGFELATMERFAYGGGGMLRVHDVATGALVKTALAVRNSSPVVLRFSADGQYLGYPDHYAVGGLVVLRTSDWGTALTVGGGTTLFGFSSDGSLWTSDYRRIRVPDGGVLQTVTLPPDTLVEAYTPDNRFLLANGFVDFQYTNVLHFLRTSDASVRVTYTFPGVTAVYGGQIDSTGAFFTYSICSAECTVYVARVPAI